MQHFAVVSLAILVQVFLHRFNKIKLSIACRENREGREERAIKILIIKKKKNPHGGGGEHIQWKQSMFQCKDLRVCSLCTR